MSENSVANTRQAGTFARRSPYNAPLDLALLTAAAALLLTG